MSTRDTIYEPISRQMKRLFKTIVSKNFENIFSTFNISIFPGKVSDIIKENKKNDEIKIIDFVRFKVGEGV